MRTHITTHIINLVLLISIIGITTALGQNVTGSHPEEKPNNMASLSVLPKQVVSTNLKMKDVGALVHNTSDQVADIDVSAFNFQGTEIARESVELAPNSSTQLTLEKLFPDINTDLVGEIKLQGSSRESQEMPADAVQLSVAFFSQRDPRWKYDRLGTCSGYTIGTAGCAITSIAMAGARSVYNMQPASLNAYLTNNGGYSGGCNVIWANAANIDGRYGFTYVGSSTVGSAANLKAIINGNKFAIARSARFSSHYVTIIGYKNQGAYLSDFYYLDPWDLTATFRYVGDGFVSSTSTIRIYQ